MSDGVFTTQKKRGSAILPSPVVPSIVAQKISNFKYTLVSPRAKVGFDPNLSRPTNFTDDKKPTA